MKKFMFDALSAIAKERTPKNYSFYCNEQVDKDSSQNEAIFAKIMYETVAALSDHGVNIPLIKQHWQAKRFEAWGYTHKITLIYLVTGQLPEGEEQYQGIPELPKEKRLAPVKALQEMCGLDCAQLKTLIKCFITGISGDELRAMPPSGPGPHRPALTNRLIGNTPRSEPSTTPAADISMSPS